MATRRKANTAQVLPEEEALRSDQSQPIGPQRTRDMESGSAATSQSPGEGPMAAQPMAQNKNAADMEERIRRRAYEIYEARGRQDGRAEEDWLLAEEEITGITGGG
jgi:Protein of unknown function (DUF2934)